MNIAITSRSKIEDIKYWSGTIKNIYNALKLNKRIKIIKIDNLNNSIRKIHALKREVIKFTKNEKYDDAYNETVSKNFSNQIQNKINKINKIDCILCFDASLVSYLKTDIPIILWTDLLYSHYYDHYYKNKKIVKNSLNSINKIEISTIKKAKKILLPTKWALAKAKNKYIKYSRKFYLLPFGPNFKTKIKKKNVKKIISRRSKNCLYLLTLSVDWERKGIEKLIKLKEIIKKKNIKIKLLIIGLKKKTLLKDKDIKIIPFIDKTNINGEKKISNYLVRSHFHILFSTAEAYGISLIEANSRAVPNISFKVGGISNVIKKNINGKLFKKDEDLDVIADYIIRIYQNKKKYYKLAKSSYDYYYKNFEYSKIINNFVKLIK